MAHERHSDEREFDLRCEECRARATRKMRAQVRQNFLEEGLSEEQADDLLARLDQTAAQLRSDLVEGP